LLYVLIVGSTLHGAWVALATTLSTFAAFDIAASAVPMTLALKQISSCLRQTFLSRP
jgi:hypothetical protein